MSFTVNEEYQRVDDDFLAAVAEPDDETVEEVEEEEDGEENEADEEDEEDGE